MKGCKGYSYESDESCCRSTYESLHEWFKRMFEQLGWMILASYRGETDKIETYKRSLIRLKNALEERAKYMNDQDKKQDLMILHRDLMRLMSHVKMDFPSREEREEIEEREEVEEVEEEMD